MSGFFKWITFMLMLGILGAGCTRQVDLAKIAARNITYQMTHSVQPAPARLEVPARNNPGIHAGWIGHSSVLVSFSGANLLIDPNFSRRIKIARRVVDVPIKPEEIRDLDFILISHSHYDHLDVPSLKRLPKQAVLIVPKGCRDLVDNLGYVRVIEMGWNENYEADGLRIEAISPIHWGKRSPFDDKARGYNSYLISKGGKTILFAGDTAYSRVFGEVGKQRKISLAFFPISAYKPDWFQRNHASPEQALQMFLESGADYMIPIHWGTFILSHEPLGEPVERLNREARRLAIQDRVIVLRQGESFTLPVFSHAKAQRAQRKPEETHK